MAWNLADEFAVPGKPRPFFLPLAAIPPGSSSVRAVDLDQFFLQDIPDTNDLAQRIDPFLRIDAVTSGGSEGTLPDPAIRLHAMAPGMLRFVPAAGSATDRLILQMCIFAEPNNVAWWSQWLRSGHLPYELIYDNVDAFVLEAMLWKSTDLSLVGTPGLSLPAGVTDKKAFLDKFMAGEAGYELSAVAGAVIGVAGAHPTNSNQRRLDLRVRYNTHTAADPRPMNPREFFYLLFGDDSAEAHATTGHPLLRQMQQRGTNQTGLATNTMRLRPPLHTFKRAEWEADQEIQNFPDNWKNSGDLTGRLFNGHSRRPSASQSILSFDRGSYKPSSKCNIFAFDVCLRAGFRVVIHQTPGSWHYIDANSTCNLGKSAHSTLDRKPLLGIMEDKSVRCGWNVDGWITAATDRRTSINNAIRNEGRCFLMVAGLGRRFEETSWKAGTTEVKGIRDCQASLKVGSGHVVIVREVLDPPTVTNGVITRLKAATSQAGSSGASRFNWTFQVDARLSGAGTAATPVVYVQVIELEPGGDPGTVWGLRDLNVRGSNGADNFTIKVSKAIAADRRMTHDKDGKPLPEATHKCCRDSDNATTTIVDC